MKKFLLFIALIAAMFAFNTKSDAVTDAILDFDYDTTFSRANGFDTVVIGNDSVAVFSKRSMKQGYTYYLYLNRRSGASKDTAMITLVSDAYNSDDSLMGRAWSADTITDSQEGVMLEIPVWSTSQVGNKFTVKLKMAHAGSVQTQALIFNVIELWRARPVQLQRMIGR